ELPAVHADVLLEEVREHRMEIDEVVVGVEEREPERVVHGRPVGPVALVSRIHEVEAEGRVVPRDVAPTPPHRGRVDVDTVVAVEVAALGEDPDRKPPRATADLEEATARRELEAIHQAPGLLASRREEPLVVLE